MAKGYVSKADSDDDYRVDGRATVNVPLRPASTELQDSSVVIIVSGVRVNDDVFPPGS